MTFSGKEKGYKLKSEKFVLKIDVSTENYKHI